MNLLDNIQNLADQTQNQIKVIKDTAIPVEIQNLKKSHNRILEELIKLEQESIPENNPVALSRITHLRTFLMTHYGHLMRGGEPEPVPGGKLHPIYIEAKNGFADLDSRLSALEKKYQNCSFGYQTADGQILKPTLDWTEDQWLQIKNSARDQVARCWLISDKNQYC